MPSRSNAARGGVWRTLRFRLAAWNAAVVVVTALVTLFGLRQGVRWALVHELDQVLIDDAREIGLTVASTPVNGMPQLREDLARMALGHEHSGWYVKLLDRSNSVLWSSAGARPNVPAPSLDDDLAPISFDGYRIVNHLVREPVQGIVAIRVGATLDRVAQDMARIDRWVLLAAGAVSIVAPVCGYWLAARAARTMGELITTASRLRPSHLDERLPIRGSGDELDQLAQTVNSLLDRIAAYVDTKRDFLANAAHELRTPLAAIRSSVEVALNHDRTAEDYEELLIDVINECSALEALVNQLLLLSEAEADLPEVRFETVDMQRMVEKSVDMFNGVADARGVALRTGALSPAPVAGNAGHLRQVLNNLIDNALKYTPEGGEIVVSLDVDDVQGMVTLKVRDTGPGISAEEQKHVFDRFYRAESARSRGHGPTGTGLGLSICLSVIQRHGGGISCASEMEGGTTFSVTLPLSRKSPAGLEASAV